VFIVMELDAGAIGVGGFVTIIFKEGHRFGCGLRVNG
jgi:hypothetical protein